jgi:hypothetical protein
MDCPYYKDAENRCLASITRLSPDAEDSARYCTTEEHYRCPLLLASVLRGNAPSAGKGLALQPEG